MTQLLTKKLVLQLSQGLEFHYVKELTNFYWKKMILTHGNVRLTYACDLRPSVLDKYNACISVQVENSFCLHVTIKRKNQCSPDIPPKGREYYVIHLTIPHNNFIPVK